MSREKDLHQQISGTVLCQLTLLESERHELLAAYEHRRKRSPYPVMALQIFAHNVREHSTVAIYLAHAPDLLQFAHDSSLQWLEQHIVDAWRARRDARLKSPEPIPTEDAA